MPWWMSSPITAAASGVRILADYLVVDGFLTKSDGRYGLGGRDQGAQHVSQHVEHQQRALLGREHLAQPALAQAQPLHRHYGDRLHLCCFSFAIAAQNCSAISARERLSRSSFITVSAISTLMPNASMRGACSSSTLSITMPSTSPA